MFQAAFVFGKPRAWRSRTPYGFSDGLFVPSFPRRRAGFWGWGGGVFFSRGLRLGQDYPRRGKDEGCGWVSLLYLRPEFRGKGFGVQLIGCAAAYFASKGRRAVRLHVAVTNTHAIDFYRHFGFTELGTEPGVASDQLLMERTN